MKKHKNLSMELLEKAHNEALEEYKVEDNKTIFRYMDLAKFMSLLQSKSIHLTRADKFDDPLEGQIPKFYHSRINNTSLLSKKEVKENEIKNLYDRVEELKKRIFISCWNESAEESYALWQIYTNKYGVAIKTTVKKLEEVIKNSETKIYKVKYITGNESNIILPDIPVHEDKKTLKHMINFFLLRNFFVLKQIHYQYENEVRLILLSENEDSNKIISINDLTDFISEIYVSPFAEEWFYGLVKNIIHNKYDLKDIKIVKSSVQLKNR